MNDDSSVRPGAAGTVLEFVSFSLTPIAVQALHRLAHKAQVQHASHKHVNKALEEAMQAEKAGMLPDTHHNPTHRARASGPDFPPTPS